jgi:hypothetical protein
VSDNWFKLILEKHPDVSLVEAKVANLGELAQDVLPHSYRFTLTKQAFD